jgi:hypothetical protein
METWIENPVEVHRGPIFSVLNGTVRLDDGRTVKRKQQCRGSEEFATASHNDHASARLG